MDSLGLGRENRGAKLAVTLFEKLHRSKMDFCASIPPFGNITQ